MSNQIRIGDLLPSFKVKDSNGKTVTEKDILGKETVIYFYPKDDTPGCTKEACQFRDDQPHFENLDVKVFGVSPDNSSSHQKFIEKHNLNFTLLSDEDKTMSQTFGVWGEKKFMGKTYMGIIRSTFIVDKKGVICWIESPVDVKNHIKRVKQALEKKTS